MSVERYVNRSLARWAVAKVAGDLVVGASRVMAAVGRTVDDVADAFLVVEADAAARYEAATGRSPARLMGHPELYTEHLCEEVTTEEEDD